MSTDHGVRKDAGRATLWGVAGAAVLLLVLGASGTLASWTQASVDNQANTVTTASAVILRESLGTATCTSTDEPQSAVNSSSCTTIDAYGGSTAPLVPGGAAHVQDVVFTNTGPGSGLTFELSAGSCTQSPAPGAGTPPTTDLCTSGHLDVAVSCSPGASFDQAGVWGDLARGTGIPTTPLSHTATGGELGAGATWTCRISVSLAGDAPMAAQGVTVSQPLTWTVNG